MNDDVRSEASDVRGLSQYEVYNIHHLTPYDSRLTERE
jgi:hypothetical protein